LLKNHAGVLLTGDYTSLQWLREVVHDVNFAILSSTDRPLDGRLLSTAVNLTGPVGPKLMRWNGPSQTASSA
jgi:hypothetical protein